MWFSLRELRQHGELGQNPNNMLCSVKISIFQRILFFQELHVFWKNKLIRGKSQVSQFLEISFTIRPRDFRLRFHIAESFVRVSRLTDVNTFSFTIQVRSGLGAYAGAARRCVHIATILLRPPSSHRPGRRQARHTHILQIGLRLAIAQADARPVMSVSFRKEST